MGRILAIDFGQKRVGIAVTDELRIIATGLTTVHAKDIFSFLDQYTKQESVDLFVVGEPRQMNNTASDAQRFTEPFVKQLKKRFPLIPVDRVDERFTSMMAQQTILDAGLKKKDRQNKELVDKVSATIMLQSYMQGIRTKRLQEGL
ncbi:MAG: Holliday junction resolvase RuvX [Bacteroidales bacterium]|nr:Holliday junction resolvase RuvX [Bacteroidales bacterium]